MKNNGCQVIKLFICTLDEDEQGDCDYSDLCDGKCDHAEESMNDCCEGIIWCTNEKANKATTKKKGEK